MAFGGPPRGRGGRGAGGDRGRGRGAPRGGRGASRGKNDGDLVCGLRTGLQSARVSV